MVAGHSLVPVSSQPALPLAAVPQGSPGDRIQFPRLGAWGARRRSRGLVGRFGAHGKGVGQGEGQVGCFRPAEERSPRQGGQLPRLSGGAFIGCRGHSREGAC